MTLAGDELDDSLLLAPENFSFFFTMSADEMEALIPLFERVALPAGQTILEADGAGDGLFLVASGLARMHHSLVVHPRQAKTLAILQPGDFFGETNLVDESPNPFSVTSMADMVLYHLPKKDFLGFLKDRPTLVLNLMKTLFQRGSEGIRRINLELALEYEVGRILSQSLPLKEMVVRLLKQMVLSLEVDAAVMLYTNAATGAYEVIGALGEKADKTWAIHFNPHFPALVSVKHVGHPVVYEPAMPEGQDTPPSGAPMPGLETHHLLLSPLLEGDRMDGVIVLMDPRDGKPFGHFEQMVMDDLCNVLSSAIGIARQRDLSRARERLSQKRFR